jgi:hypothetical protein
MALMVIAKCCARGYAAGSLVLLEDLFPDNEVEDGARGGSGYERFTS